MYSRCVGIVLLLGLWTGILALPTRSELIEYARKNLLVQGTIDKIFFVPTPPNNPIAKLILLGLIHHEKKAIHLLQYRLTEPDVVEALIAALKRGVQVEIIIDHGSLYEKKGAIDQLKKAGAAVTVYQKSYSLMHIKMFLFSCSLARSIVWCGSANTTQNGYMRNQEFITVRDSTLLFEKCLHYFAHLKKSLYRDLIIKTILSLKKSEILTNNCMQEGNVLF